MSAQVRIIYIRKTGTTTVTDTSIEQDFHVVVQVIGAHPSLHQQLAEQAVNEFARLNNLTVNSTQLLEHEITQ
jgi:hypothetical protein